MGLGSIPFEPIKKLLSFLQYNYRGRLYKMYIVNAPTSVYIPWQMVKKFLQEATVQKIQFLNKQIPAALATHANSEQVEQKYGGTAPNLVKFWPPIIPSNNYFLKNEESKCLVSKQEYNARYTSGQLATHKVNMAFIESSALLKLDSQGKPMASLLASPGREALSNATGLTSCDTSVVKSKVQGEFSSSNPETKIEVLSRPKEQNCLNVLGEDYDYTEMMDENNIYGQLHVLQAIEFSHYFLNKQEI